MHSIVVQQPHPSGGRGAGGWPERTIGMARDEPEGIEATKPLINTGAGTTERSTRQQPRLDGRGTCRQTPRGAAGGDEPQSGWGSAVGQTRHLSRCAVATELAPDLAWSPEPKSSSRGSYHDAMAAERAD